MDEFSFQFGGSSEKEGEKFSYWVKKEFPDEEPLIMSKVGNWSFTQKYESERICELEFLEFIQESFQSKKDEHIQNKVIDKLKAIAPRDFGCIPSLYASSKHYRTWFILRESFFIRVNQEYEWLNTYDDVKYFMWNTSIDNQTPKECQKLNNSIFCVDEDFKLIANKHWAEAREFCRCGINVLSERKLIKLKLKAP